VEGNLPLAQYWANKYYEKCPKISSAINADDLFQVGCIGLIRAVSGWKPELGKFTTWATFYIREEIRNEISNYGYALRIPLRSAEANCPGTAEAKALRVKEFKTERYLKVYTSAPAVEPDEREGLLAAINCLSKMERAVILNELEGSLNKSQLSRLWKCSHTNISNIYRKAMAKLKERLVPK
jgi:RNA polymerase sigma factor (sigma-70 family)